MKVSFVYDDGYLIQLQFAFRRSLRNGVPLHGKRGFVWQDFIGEESPELHGIAADSVRFHFQVHPHIRIIITVVGTSVSSDFSQLPGPIIITHTTFLLVIF